MPPPELKATVTGVGTCSPDIPTLIDDRAVHRPVSENKPVGSTRTGKDVRGHLIIWWFSSCLTRDTILLRSICLETIYLLLPILWSPYQEATKPMKIFSQRSLAVRRQRPPLLTPRHQLLLPPNHKRLPPPIFSVSLTHPPLLFRRRPHRPHLQSPRVCLTSVHPWHLRPNQPHQTYRHTLRTTRTILSFHSHHKARQRNRASWISLLDSR